MLSEGEDGGSSRAKLDGRAAVCVQPGAWSVRVHGAGPSEWDAVARDAGPAIAEEDASTARNSNAPDVIVRFVDRLEPGPLRFLDGDRFAYDAKGFYAMRRGRAEVAARITGRDSELMEIECLRGESRVPLLGAVLDLSALRAGWAPLHASAWRTSEGRGVLLSGWAGSGKTGVLLTACARGGAFVGDDRILVHRGDPGGPTLMAGVGRPVVIKRWHVGALDGDVLPREGGLARRSLGARLVPALDAMGRRAGALRGQAPRLARKALDRFRNRPEAEIRLHELRSAAGPKPPLARPVRPTASPTSGQPARPLVTLDLVILLETHDAPSVEVEPVTPGALAPRLAAHAAVDLLPALRADLARAYERGGEGWPSARAAADDLEEILRDALGDVDGCIVRHPHPCRPGELHDVIDELAHERGEPSHDLEIGRP